MLLLRRVPSTAAAAGVGAVTQSPTGARAVAHLLLLLLRGRRREVGGQSEAIGARKCSISGTGDVAPAVIKLDFINPARGGRVIGWRVATGADAAATGPGRGGRGVTRATNRVAGAGRVGVGGVRGDRPVSTTTTAAPAQAADIAVDVDFSWPSVVVYYLRTSVAAGAVAVPTAVLGKAVVAAAVGSGGSGDTHCGL